MTLLGWTQASCIINQSFNLLVIIVYSTSQSVTYTQAHTNTHMHHQHLCIDSKLPSVKSSQYINESVQVCNVETRKKIFFFLNSMSFYTNSLSFSFPWISQMQYKQRETDSLDVISQERKLKLNQVLPVHICLTSNEPIISSKESWRSLHVVLSRLTTVLHCSFTCYTILNSYFWNYIVHIFFTKSSIEILIKALN